MLIVHKSKAIPFAKLAKIPTQVKWGGMAEKRTKGVTAHSWMGVKHSSLIAAIQEEFGTPSKETVQSWVAHNGGTATMCFPAPESSSPFWVGALASNISLSRLKVYCGLCRDGVRLVSEALTGAPYNQNFDLSIECRALVAGWKNATAKCNADEYRFRSLRLISQESDRMILECGRSRILPWKYLGRLDEEFKERPDCTGWDLLAAFSKVVSSCPPITQLEKLFAVRNMLARKISITQPEAA